MAAHDVIGAVCDRLVGGVMFHSEHADLCHYAGVDGLAKLHEDGFVHDSRCLRKMRRLCIRHLGVPAPEGRQDRTHALDAHRSTKRWDLSPDVAAATVKDAMHAWVDWESGTVTVLTSACARLMDAGELLLADKVKSMAKETSRELAHARDLMCEMESVGWDMSHVHEMDYE